MNFGIHEIPNQAKLYFEELRENTLNTRNPMEDYHNYSEVVHY